MVGPFEIEEADCPSWPGGVSAPKALTGWWFKFRNVLWRSLDNSVVGSYVLDFYFPEHQSVIEIIGDSKAF